MDPTECDPDGGGTDLGGMTNKKTDEPINALDENDISLPLTEDALKTETTYADPATRATFKPTHQGVLLEAGEGTDATNTTTPTLVKLQLDQIAEEGVELFRQDSNGRV